MVVVLKTKLGVTIGSEELIRELQNGSYWNQPIWLHTCDLSMHRSSHIRTLKSQRTPNFYSNLDFNQGQTRSKRHLNLTWKNRDEYWIHVRFDYIFAFLYATQGESGPLTLIFMSKHPAMSRKCPTFFTAWKCGHSICFIWYDNLQLGKKDPLRYQVYSNCFFTFMSSTPTSLQIFYYIPR